MFAVLFDSFIFCTGRHHVGFYHEKSSVRFEGGLKSKDRCRLDNDEMPETYDQKISTRSNAIAENPTKDNIYNKEFKYLNNLMKNNKFNNFFPFFTFLVSHYFTILILSNTVLQYYLTGIVIINLTCTINSSL